MITRSQKEREDLIKQWKESGKAMGTWCRENLIPESTFFYWINPRKPQGKAHTEPQVDRSDFTELRNEESGTGIIIECQGIKISIEKHFDTLTLENFLKILMRQKC